MLIDTHCHINTMVKNEFEKPLLPIHNQLVQKIIDQAAQKNVTIIINVGTSLIESTNCIYLAQNFSSLWATVGLHPNDCSNEWQHDFKQIETLVKKKNNNKICGIGECGMDFHYPDYHVQRQKDAFKAQIELALNNDLALVVHTRDARDETLQMLEEFAGQIKRGVIHCFSEDIEFAKQVIEWNFVIGIGGTLTYPKNESLRMIAQTIPLEKIVLETDAPFLPPQEIRGKQNHPMHIATIAEFLSQLRKEPLETITQQTTQNALNLYSLNNFLNPTSSHK
jgi:TatD DNase family protein